MNQLGRTIIDRSVAQRWWPLDLLLLHLHHHHHHLLLLPLLFCSSVTTGTRRGRPGPPFRSPFTSSRFRLKNQRKQKKNSVKPSNDAEWGPTSFTDLEEIWPTCGFHLHHWLFLRSFFFNDLRYYFMDPTSINVTGTNGWICWKSNK